MAKLQELAFLLLVVCRTNSQDESLTAVTIDMFVELEREILALNSKIGTLQDELQALALQIQSLSTETAAVGSVELAELQALIEVSNNQEAELGRLRYFNELWQQNFRSINITFERLRKVIVFPKPTLVAAVVVARPQQVLPSISERTNVTLRMGNQIKSYSLSNLKTLKNITFPAGVGNRGQNHGYRTSTVISVSRFRPTTVPRSRPAGEADMH